MANLIEKVIIVDESDGNVLFWEMLLTDLKLTIFKARTGAKALEVIEKEDIQLAIVAWELSSMSGAILLQKVKANTKRRRMPFIIYSKRMSDEDVQITREIGVDNVLNMPFDKAKVREIITRLIEDESNISPLEVKLRHMEDFLGEGKPTEVLKMVGPHVSEQGPHLPRYKTIIAETFLQIGNLDKALKAADECLEVDGSYLPGLYIKARLLSAWGRHNEAIAVLKAVAESRPQSIQPLVNLGSAYISADKIEDAKKTIDKISSLDPDCEETKDNKGKIALKEGNIGLAAQLLSETQNGDEIARFYNSIGISMVAKGDFESGIETYQSAIKILSSKTKLHLLFFNLALAYRKKGDIQNEVAYFCESYVTEPSFEKAYACIARGVQEAKVKGVTLNMPTLNAVLARRKVFLTENPKAAERIKERLEKASAAS